MIWMDGWMNEEGWFFYFLFLHFTFYIFTWMNAGWMLDECWMNDFLFLFLFLFLFNRSPPGHDKGVMMDNYGWWRVMDGSVWMDGEGHWGAHAEMGRDNEGHMQRWSDGLLHTFVPLLSSIRKRWARGCFFEVRSSSAMAWLDASRDTLDTQHPLINVSHKKKK